MTQKKITKKFGIIAQTLNDFNNLVNHLPAKDIQFKDYWPNEANKSFTGILHLDNHKLEDLKSLLKELGNDSLFVYKLGRRDKNAEYKTTIEKLEDDGTFCVLKKDGSLREKKIYIYKGYSRENKKYCGQSYEDINKFRYFKKGKQVIANPSF
jgi:hypothetical protein